MAKSNMQLLQDALARGDVEAAKKYAEKIEKAQSKGKKKTSGSILVVADKPKKVAAPKRPRKAKEAPEEHEPTPSQARVKKPPTAVPRPQKGTRLMLPQQEKVEPEAEDGVLDIYDMRHGFYASDPSSFLAPVYREGAGGVRVGKDGKVMREARKVQLSIDPGKVKFWDPGKRMDGLNPKQRQIDAALAKQTATPRPGMGFGARPVAVKQRVNCDFCGRPEEVYPSELLQAHDEKGRPYLYHKCERCIRGGGR